MTNSSSPVLAVLGDLMLDEWIVGTATRISPEAPVPILKFSRRRTTAGGAANVAANIVSLGGRARLCGVWGHDAAGDDLAAALQSLGVDAAFCVRDEARPTTLKTRIVAATQQVARVDREDASPFSPGLVERIGETLPSLLAEAALLCVSDYAKGLVTDAMMQNVVREAKARRVLLVGGPKPRNLARFGGFDFLSFNLKEAAESLDATAGAQPGSDEEVARAGEALRRRTNARALVITRGGRGATLCEEGRAPHHLPAHEVEVFDVAGAGDTFLAGACVALANGADNVEAARMGNLAAAASVRHAGVVAVTREELRRLEAE